MAKESFHVYMNLDVVNNSSETPKRLVFNMTRTIPFLTNAEDYFLTVARFNLQTSNSLPVFIPDIQTGQPDPNVTSYIISLSASYQGQAQRQISAVIYESMDTSQPLPSSPTTAVDKSSSYYWVYNVNDWVNMLNNTFVRLTTNLNTVLSGANFTAPYIQYDLTTGLFTLYVPQDAVLNNTFKVGFNPSLYNILPFSSIYAPRPGPAPGAMNYIININNSIANQSTVLVSGTRINFLSTTTEFSPLPILCPIRSIYFATNLLPIEPLLSQPPKVLTDSTLLWANAGVPGITNILTDFQITVTPSNNYNGEISYLPSPEYRWVDLTQGMNLNKIDIQAFWKDKYGNAYEIYLPEGCSANIKLLFRRRDYYSPNNI
jgi:hypothetical protein